MYRTLKSHFLLCVYFLWQTEKILGGGKVLIQLYSRGMRYLDFQAGKLATDSSDPEL